MGVLYNKNNNIIYEGEFAFGKIEGIGKAYNDEDYYIGQFANSNLNGKGIIYNLDDTIKFEGTFENGKCKEGRFNYSDGSYYIGEFMNDYKHELNMMDIIIKVNMVEKDYYILVIIVNIMVNLLKVHLMGKDIILKMIY